MRALLDTNIVIHREASKIKNISIGTLFKWLDKGKYVKCVHPLTVEELKKNICADTVDTFLVKLDSYEVLKTVAPLSPDVVKAVQTLDLNANDANDTQLLNEVYCNRVDFLISEDKKIHAKAHILKIADRVFSIDSFLERVVAEHPELIDYNILSVKKTYLGNINLQDPFFDSFREDYPGFDNWFNKKSDEIAYVTINKGKILSFLFLKVEGKEENYSDISPVMLPKKRLKIRTFKVESNGVRLGERFLKIVFDNALANKVDEIYVTIFDKREEQKRLISLLEEWGFHCHGKKQDELVYVRQFRPSFDPTNPRTTYPFISRNSNIFLVPIYPEYHTELLPDSILKTESPTNFVENQPHRNAISKVYISRSLEKGLCCGDIIIFYRTGGFHKSVITTIGIVDRIILDIADEKDFISKCRKRSIFTDEELMEHWDHNKALRPFIVNFLYVYSFPKRPNMRRLVEVGIIRDVNSAPRGFEKITKDQFDIILKETESDASIIVD